VVVRLEHPSAPVLARDVGDNGDGSRSWDEVRVWDADVREEGPADGRPPVGGGGEEEGLAVSRRKSTM
jgi:hypothetical protein